MNNEILIKSLIDILKHRNIYRHTEPSPSIYRVRRPPRSASSRLAGCQGRATK